MTAQSSPIDLARFGIPPTSTFNLLCGEVVAAFSAEEPRTSRDIFDQCPSATRIDDVSRAIYALKQRDLLTIVDMAEPSGAPGSRRVPRYVLSAKAADARLLTHLEHELAESAALDDGPIGTRNSPIGPRNIADPAPAAEPPQAPVATDETFIARHIAGLEDPEPRVLGARQWATLVGAIADRLAAGRSLPPDPEVIRALRTAQQELLEVAA